MVNDNFVSLLVSLLPPFFCSFLEKKIMNSLFLFFFFSSCTQLNNVLNITHTLCVASLFEFFCLRTAPQRFIPLVWVSGANQAVEAAVGSWREG